MKSESWASQHLEVREKRGSHGRDQEGECSEDRNQESEMLWKPREKHIWRRRMWSIISDAINKMRTEN